MSADFRWRVEERDTGLPVAQGSATTQTEASREMMYYAGLYVQDGPVSFWIRSNRKTVLTGVMNVASRSTTTRP